MAKAKPRPLVRDLLRAVEAVAPLRLAADWDNVGLIAGRPEWPARTVLAAIDLTDAVARQALRARADALLLYHPPIFKGVKRITPNAEAPTSLLPDLLAARMSLIAVHTALDAAAGGTNDVLLDAFDIVERYPLSHLMIESLSYKLVVFAPPADVERLRAALSAAGAGVIGAYSECSFALEGSGSFRGSETTNPVIGRKGRLEFVDETRVEMVVPRAAIGPVVRALYAAHRYEEPAFDLYPVHSLAQRANAGMGRVGVLRKPQPGGALLAALAKIADLSRATKVGEIERRFTSVTAAAGAFGVSHFTNADSLVLTGEFKHHDALELVKRGVSAVHMGHDASERPGLRTLVDRMKSLLPATRLTLAAADVSPFQPLAIAAPRGRGPRA